MPDYIGMALLEFFQASMKNKPVFQDSVIVWHWLASSQLLTGKKLKMIKDKDYCSMNAKLISLVTWLDTNRQKM